MKILLSLLAITMLLASLLSMQACSKKEPPALPYTVDVITTSRGTGNSATYRPVIVQLRSSSLKESNPALHCLYLQEQGVTRGNGTKSFTQKVEAKQRTLFLAVYYDEVNKQGWMPPSAKEYVEAEVKINGTSLGKVRVDSSSCFNSSAYWAELPGSKINVVQELAITLP